MSTERELFWSLIVILVLVATWIALILSELYSPPSVRNGAPTASFMWRSRSIPRAPAIMVMKGTTCLGVVT